MRVIYFHQYFKTPKGKGGVRSYRMARALVDAGHEVHMICGGDEAELTELASTFKNGKRSGYIDGIKITQLEINYSNHMSLVERTVVFFKYAARSTKLALTEEYDLLFATSTPLTAGIPGIFASILRRKKFVFEVRDLWPELPKAMGVVRNPLVLWGMSVLEWTSYRTSAGCIGLSPGIVKGVQKRSRTGYEVALVPNGCDLDTFDRPEIDIAQIPGVDSTDFVAMFTGAHGIAQGLQSVLAAAEILKNKNIENIKIVFVGDGKLKLELLEIQRAKKLDNCLFLDAVPQLDLLSYLKRANVCLMILANIPAFYYGTSPNKFFDYLASGRPVLNNYPGWLADMITEHDLGAVVKPDSPEEFSDALIHLSALDESTLEKYGSNARRLAINEFERNKLADKFVRFLSKVHSL